MKDEIIIGTDIGTGSCKAVAVTVSGKVLGETQSFYNTLRPKEGYSELEPDEIKNAYFNCIRELVQKLPEAPAAISISSAMHSLMMIDKNNKPLTRLITWEDTRSYPVAKKLRNTAEGKKIYKATGTPIHSMSPLCKIAWFKNNQKILFSKTEKFAGIKEYIWFNIFNCWEVDYSVASAMGLFDILELQWYLPALKYCGIDKTKLSQPVKTTFIRKNPSQYFLKATGLPENVQICIGASDGCLANLGSHITGKGKASVTIGTSGAIRITTHKPVIDTNEMTFNYLLDNKTFISGGPLNNGGNVIKWFMREFMNKTLPEKKDFSDLSQEVSKIPAGSDGIMCLPYFNGERAPVWDEKAAAVWMGVKAFHSKYHLIRATQEGICYTMKMILENLEKKDRTIHTIYASGGFTHSPEWLQMMANITGKKIIINEKEDASSMGAAFLAMRALRYKPIKEEKNNENVILPEKKSTATYQKLFQIFKKIYPLTKSYIHQLQP